MMVICEGSIMSAQNDSVQFQWVLERRGNFDEQKTVILSGTHVSVGRNIQMACALTGNLISRFHAHLKFRDSHWFVTDNNSLNGTYHNSIKIGASREVMLNDGDLISFGLPTDKINDENGFVYEVKKTVPDYSRLQQQDTDINVEENVQNTTTKEENVQNINSNEEANDIIQENKNCHNSNLIISKKEKKVDENSDLIIKDVKSPGLNEVKNRIGEAPVGINSLHLTEREQEFDSRVTDKNKPSNNHYPSVGNMNSSLPSTSRNCTILSDDDDIASVDTDIKNATFNINIYSKPVRYLRICLEDCVKSPQFKLPPNIAWKRKHETKTEDSLIEVSSSDEELTIVKKTKFETKDSTISVNTGFLSNNIISDSDNDSESDKELLNNTSYSQDDVIVISDDEDEYLRNQIQKEMKLKKEIIDEWSAEEDDWNSFNDEIEIEHHTVSVKDSWGEEKENSVSASVSALPEAEEQLVKILVDSDSENIENITQFLEQSKKEKKEEEQLSFFPELSQDFYKNDSENSEEDVFETLEVSNSSECRQENKLKKFYGAKFIPAQPLLLNSKKKTGQEKCDTVSIQPVASTSRTQRMPRDTSKITSKRKRKSNIEKLKDQVSKKMGYRIPIPGGGSAIRSKQSEIIETKLNTNKPKKAIPTKSTNHIVSHSVANQPNRSSHFENNRESVPKPPSTKRKNKQKSGGRFISRSKFLTDVPTKLPSSAQTAGHSKVSSVPSLLNSGYKIPKKTRQNPVDKNHLKEKETSNIQSETKDKPASTFKKQSIDKEGSIISRPPVITNNSQQNLILKPTTPKSIISNVDVARNSTRVQETRKKVQFSSKNETFLIPRSSGSSRLPTVIPTKSWQVEAFIRNILNWRPKWLQEQEIFHGLPPIVEFDKVWPTLQIYENIDDYVQIFKPLLLIEIWAKITKGLKETHFFVPDVVVAGLSKPNNKFAAYSCYTLISEESFCSNHIPAEGHLVQLTVLRKAQDPNAESIFGYIEKVQYSSHEPSSEDRFSPIVKHKSYGHPKTRRYDFTLNCKQQFLFDSKSFVTLKVLTYIKPSIQQFEAVICLRNSPLVYDILKPRRTTCESVCNSYNSLQIQTHNLNESQKSSIKKLYESCCQGSCPKIGLLQGPPGSGKSHTIISLIQQILSCKDMKEKTGLEPKILLTAPSNCAIDDLVVRLKQVRAKQKKEDKLKLVRVGNKSQMNRNVVDVSLDHLVKTNIDMKREKNIPQSVTTELNYLKTEEASLNSKLKSLDISREAVQINSIQSKLKELTIKRDKLLKNKEHQMQSPLSDFDRSQALVEILQNANVIATTLSSCRHKSMLKAFSQLRNCFSVCIIDEATQCIEPDSLLPLLYGMSKIVMVGDPEQLPPTVLQSEAKDLGLSLFERIYKLFQNDSDVILFLNKQYRMHPEICKFPSRWFYNGGLNTYELLSTRYSACPFIPYCLFNLCNSREEGNKNGEKYNSYELEFILELLTLISSKNTQNLSIGIITPYQAQKIRFKEEMRKRLISNHSIEVNTVDAFQGQERDIIIFGCVRANDKHQIGFLSDRKRLNVALTRAKQCLILCGHFQSLKNYADWFALYKDAEERNCVFNVSSDTAVKDVITKILKKK